MSSSISCAMSSHGQDYIEFMKILDNKYPVENYIREGKEFEI